MGRLEKQFEYKGKLYTFRELSELSGLAIKTIQRRLKYWGDIEKCIDTPLVKNKNAYKSGIKCEYSRPQMTDLFKIVNHLM